MADIQYGRGTELTIGVQQGRESDASHERVEAKLADFEQSGENGGEPGEDRGDGSQTDLFPSAFVT